MVGPCRILPGKLHEVNMKFRGYQIYGIYVHIYISVFVDLVMVATFFSSAATSLWGLVLWALYFGHHGAYG